MSAKDIVQKRGDPGRRVQHEKTMKRYEVFVAAYLANGRNGKAAALEAGFTPKNAASQATRLLKTPAVQEMLKAKESVLLEKLDMTAESVLRELAAIVHADLRQLINDDGSLKPVQEWPDNVARAISSLEIEEEFDGQGKQRKQVGWTKKLKLWDKNAALEKAMRYFKLLGGDGGVSINAGTVIISKDDAKLC